MQLKKDLVVLDLETTGTWIDKDKIIEIAMIKVTPKGEEVTFDEKVNPGIPIPKAVTELTGISDKEATHAPKFSDIANKVLEFIGKSDLAGFNVERFDLPLLQRECDEAGVKFSWKERTIYDAQKIYHLNEKRDLTAAYQFYCGKHLEGAHAALADTRATLEILQEQNKKYGKKGGYLEDLQEFQYQLSSEFFDSDRKFRWWNGKLYMMFGKYARKKSLQEVVKSDRGYLEWILSSNFSEEIKGLVSDALNGHYPASPETKQGELFD